MRLRTIAMVCLVLCLAVGTVVAKPLPAGPLSNLRIVINLPSRTLSLYSGDSLVKDYPVAIGRTSSPSPLGSFRITSKEVNPWWYPPPDPDHPGDQKKPVPSGPENPLGYRWMEFAPMYGIHGTNVPSSIGRVVSNGCIRMREVDVEEVYDRVPVGTPVRIIYERAQIVSDESGRLFLGLFPDVYGYHRLTLDEVRSMLVDRGMAGLLPEDAISRALETGKEQRLLLVDIAQIAVNGKTLKEPLLRKGSEQYVPALPLAEAAVRAAFWDDKSGKVKTVYDSATALAEAAGPYLPLEEARRLFGGRQQWDGPNMLNVTIPSVRWDGRTLDMDVQVIDNIYALPAVQLAANLGKAAAWNEKDGSFLLDGRSVPVHILNQRPYVLITEVLDQFGAHLYWNEAENTFQLTYPFTPPQ